MLGSNKEVRFTNLRNPFEGIQRFGEKLSALRQREIEQANLMKEKQLDRDFQAGQNSIRNALETRKIDQTGLYQTGMLSNDKTRLANDKMYKENMIGLDANKYNNADVNDKTRLAETKRHNIAMENKPVGKGSEKNALTPKGMVYVDEVQIDPRTNKQSNIKVAYVPTVPNPNDKSIKMIPGPDGISRYYKKFMGSSGVTQGQRNAYSYLGQWGD